MDSHVKQNTETSGRIRTIKADSRKVSLDIATMTLEYAVSRTLHSFVFIADIAIENGNSVTHILRVARGS